MVPFCLHLANILYLFSYLVFDMLWLRVLTCLGLGLGIVFYSCQTAPLYGATFWHAAFFIINIVQICRLLVVRRQLMLNRSQEEICEKTFQDLNRDELLTLLARVTWRNPDSLRDFRQLCREPLTQEERVLREIAFSRLSRQEILNLLTRRLWNGLKRLNPTRWRQGRRRDVAKCVNGPPKNITNDIAISE